MKNTKDIARVLNIGCFMNNCNVAERRLNGEYPQCCKMHNIAYDMILRGEY